MTTDVTADNNRALMFGLAAVLGWSTVATAFKLALQQVDTFQLLFYANLAAVLILVAYTAVTGRQRDLVAAFRNHWKLSLIAGGLNPLLYYVLLFEAYDRLPAQVAMSINYTWAIVLTFMASIFLKQKIQAIDWVAAFACYAGVVLIVTGGQLDSLHSTSLSGVLLAIGSTGIWATYWTINIKDHREPAVGLTLNFLIALPLTLALCLTFSDLTVSPSGLAASIYVGLVEMAIGFLLWSTALNLTSNASRVSNLIFLSPFLSLVFIYLFLGEKIASATFAGLLIIIGALLAQQYFRGHKDKLEIDEPAPR